jgi:hypothetical protein
MKAMNEFKELAEKEIEHVSQANTLKRNQIEKNNEVISIIDARKAQLEEILNSSVSEQEKERLFEQSLQTYPKEIKQKMAQDPDLSERLRAFIAQNLEKESSENEDNLGFEKFAQNSEPGKEDFFSAINLESNQLSNLPKNSM